MIVGSRGCFWSMGVCGMGNNQNYITWLLFSLCIMNYILFPEREELILWYRGRKKKGVSVNNSLIIFNPNA